MFNKKDINKLKIFTRGDAETPDSRKKITHVIASLQMNATVPAGERLCTLGEEGIRARILRSPHALERRESALRNPEHYYLILQKSENKSERIWEWGKGDGDLRIWE